VSPDIASSGLDELTRTLCFFSRRKADDDGDADTKKLREGLSSPSILSSSRRTQPT
jgi:hypothetical protein